MSAWLRESEVLALFRICRALDPLVVGRFALPICTRFLDRQRHRAVQYLLAHEQLSVWRPIVHKWRKTIGRRIPTVLNSTYTEWCHAQYAVQYQRFRWTPRQSHRLFTNRVALSHTVAFIAEQHAYVASKQGRTTQEIERTIASAEGRRERLYWRIRKDVQIQKRAVFLRTATIRRYLRSR